MVLLQFLTVAVSCYAFWVILYDFRRTAKLLWAVVPASVFALTIYFIILAFDIEPWWYGLVRFKVFNKIS